MGLLVKRLIRTQSSKVDGLRRHADIIGDELRHDQHKLISISEKHFQGRVEGYVVASVSPEGAATMLAHVRPLRRIPIVEMQLINPRRQRKVAVGHWTS